MFSNNLETTQWLKKVPIKNTEALKSFIRNAELHRRWLIVRIKFNSIVMFFEAVEPLTQEFPLSTRVKMQIIHFQLNGEKFNCWSSHGICRTSRMVFLLTSNSWKRVREYKAYFFHSLSTFNETSVVPSQTGPPASKLAGQICNCLSAQYETHISTWFANEKEKHRQKKVTKQPGLELSISFHLYIFGVAFLTKA